MVFESSLANVHRMTLAAEKERLSGPEMLQTTSANRGGGGVTIHSAFCKTDAPDDSNAIVCYLNSWAEGETWEVGKLYKVGDTVDGTDGHPYRCKTQHTSTNDDKPITGANWAAKWKSPEWVVDTQYNPGDLVLGTLTWVILRSYEIGDKVIGSDSELYRCIQAHQATNDNKPITGAEWETYWETLEWVSGKSYDIGQEVIGSNGHYFRCLADHTSASDNKPITGAFWDSWWVRTYLDFYIYQCIKQHVSTNNDRPISGANWATSWQEFPTVVVSCLIFGGGYLDTAAPYLQKKDEILVYRSKGLWESLWWFVGTVNCESPG